MDKPITDEDFAKLAMDFMAFMGINTVYIEPDQKLKDGPVDHPIGRLESNYIFRHWKWDNGGVLTIALKKVPGSHQTGVATYGVSFCNPKDRFDRAKGREIAMERASTTNEKGSITIEDVRITGAPAKFQDDYDILKVVMDLASTMAYTLPSWAAKEIMVELQDYIGLYNYDLHKHRMANRKGGN